MCHCLFLSSSLLFSLLLLFFTFFHQSFESEIDLEIKTSCKRMNIQVLSSRFARAVSLSSYRSGCLCALSYRIVFSFLAHISSSPLLHCSKIAMKNRRRILSLFFIHKLTESRRKEMQKGELRGVLLDQGPAPEGSAEAACR